MDLIENITDPTVRNMGGLRDRVYLAFHEDIEQFPTKPEDDASVSMENLAKLVGNFVFKPGKRFIELRIVGDTGIVLSEQQGERGGMSYKNSIQFLLAGGNAKILGLEERCTNREVVVLGQDKEGLMRVIGHEHEGAYIQPQNSTTGTAAPDRKGATFNFACSDFGPAPIYPGTIDLESGSGS